MALHAGVPHEVLPGLLQKEVVGVSHLVVDGQEGTGQRALAVQQFDAAHVCRGEEEI